MPVGDLIPIFPVEIEAFMKYITGSTRQTLEKKALIP